MSLTFLYNLAELNVFLSLLHHLQRAKLTSVPLIPEILLRLNVMECTLKRSNCYFHSTRRIQKQNYSVKAYVYVYSHIVEVCLITLVLETSLLFIFDYNNRILHYRLYHSCWNHSCWITSQSVVYDLSTTFLFRLFVIRINICVTRCRIVMNCRIVKSRYFTYGLSTSFFEFKLACLLSMGHESHGSWVKILMDHMGLGQTILTHCQLWYTSFTYLILNIHIIYIIFTSFTYLKYTPFTYLIFNIRVIHIFNI